MNRFLVILVVLAFLGIGNSYAQESEAVNEYGEVTQSWKETALQEFHGDGDAKAWESNRANRLLKLGKERAKIIKDNRYSIGVKSYVEDSIFEIKIIPLKWVGIFKLRYNMIKGHLSEGVEGLRELIPEILSLLLFIFLPFITVGLNKWILDRINEVKKSLSDPFKMTSLKQKGVLFLQRTAPFIPLAVTVFGIKGLQASLAHTKVSELNLLLPYILYYLYYQIFRQVLLIFLRFISESAQTSRNREQNRETRSKIFNSSRVAGRFIFLFLSLLHLVSSVAGKGLVFYELSLIYKVSLVFLYLWVLSKWKVEMAGFIERNAHEKISALYKKFDYKLLSPLTRSFGLIIIVSIPFIEWIKSKLLNFNLGKKFLTKIFEKQLETSEEASEEVSKTLPEKYREWFGDEKDEEDHLWVKSKNQQVDGIINELEEWIKEETDEHSLAIYGDKGIGKTQVLRSVEKWLLEKHCDIEVILAEVPPKLTERMDVLKFLGHLIIGKELTDFAELREFDKEMKPKVIILDEAHNFFLSRFGGLKGVETFFETLNVQTNNIFWIASFNTYSWAYLDQVFHKNRYFRSIFKIKGLSDEELQEYILRRHQRSGYLLSYADIIRAVNSSTEADEVNYVENLFFRLLWEQSKGNPEVAVRLWLGSLKPIRGRRLKVGLPKGRDFSILRTLSDESFFVFSALLRHENLSSGEIMKVTDMKEGHVRHCLRVGLENGLVERNEGDRRYRIKVEGQYSVISALKAKNFLYE